MKTKNKILIILASFMLLILVFNSKVFAGSEEENQLLKDIPEDMLYRDEIINKLPNDVTSLFIVNKGSDSVKVIYSTTPNTKFVIMDHNDESFILGLFCLDDNNKFTDSRVGGYSYYIDNSSSSESSFYGLFLDRDFSDYTVYSSDTIYYHNPSTGTYENFFQSAPQGLTQVLEGEMKTVGKTTQEQMKTTLITAIGILALLIGLRVLPRILKRFSK